MKNDWEDLCVALDRSRLTMRKPAIIAAVYTLSIFAPPIRTHRSSTFWLALSRQLQSTNTRSTRIVPHSPSPENLDTVFGV
jgi:hypothetical protein